MVQKSEKKGMFGLDYKTRVKIWTGIFALAIIIWICCKMFSSNQQPSHDKSPSHNEQLMHN